MSPIDEDEKNIVCAKGKKNDPRDVKQLQEALGNILGYKIQSDGNFCKNTEDQVKKFQEQAGVATTGIVCNRLWTLIMNSNYQKLTNLL